MREGGGGGAHLRDTAVFNFVQIIRLITVFTTYILNVTCLVCVPYPCALFVMKTMTSTKATVNEIHVSGQGITLQLVRAGGIHYSL